MRTILITGASKGFGAALARAHAAPGTRLVLWARDRSGLEDTARACRAEGALTEVLAIDLAETEALADALDAVDRRSAIDLAFLNAGRGGFIERGQVAEAPDQTRAVGLTNFVATTVAATVLAERMAQRRRGRLVIIGSLAGLVPLPSAPTYAASKAGLAAFAEAIRLRLAPHGVGVSLVVPAFIDTAMSRAFTNPKPLMLSAAEAAAIVAKRVAQGHDTIILPRIYGALRPLLRIVPRWALNSVLRRLEIRH